MTHPKARPCCCGKPRWRTASGKLQRFCSRKCRINTEGNKTVPPLKGYLEKS